MITLWPYHIEGEKHYLEVLFYLQQGDNKKIVQQGGTLA
jgi:hypothetical protein